MGTLSSAIQYGLSNSAEQDGTHRLLRITDIQDGRVNWDSVPFTTVNDSENYLLSTGDIVFARTGATVGKSFLIEETPYPSVYASYLIRIRLLNDIISEYIYQFFNSECYWEQITDKSVGVGQPNVNGTSLKNLLVPLAPMDEQKRIVSASRSTLKIVSKIDKNNNELLSTISSLKSKILDLAIRGKLVPQDPNDEPASVLLERIRAQKEELIKAGKIKRDKKESVIFKGEDNSYYRTNGKTIESCDNLPFDLPEGWIWTSLGQYCEKVTDQVASGSFAALRENVVSLKEPSYALMVKTADFSNGFTKNLTYTDKHGYEFLENSNLFGGELILSNIGSIGKVFIVPDLNCKMTLAPNSVMIRLTNNEYRDYLYYFLQSPIGYEELKAISTGVAMLKFNKTDLKTIYFPLPPFAEQKRIVEAIETAFAQLDEIANSIS
ncbi:MAG: restriction endonuclease subunit S [Clostridia bacterium]|nr:restriction endonuclease subunit S [Clostridia bacterium]